LRLLKEERDRERVKTQSEAAVAHGSRAQVEEERDCAIAHVQDLQQQLAAVLADLEIAKTDMDRILLSRSNLQIALESFQSEREAELMMLNEQRLESEQGIQAAHSAEMDAMREANDSHVREIQRAADASVRHAMGEIRTLEAKLETFRVENVQMRRSLDEAIYRLQATQEDVIDRTLMKNILMDWLTKTGTKERRDVLELMASVLHFSEDEKERVHIGPESGALGMVVHTVAAPLPPSKADVEHLAGDSVREKWVNFLLAETED
jgi:seryl-tRNA synthetase